MSQCFRSLNGENKNGVSGVVYDDTATEKFKSISINLKPGQALF